MQQAFSNPNTALKMGAIRSIALGLAECSDELRAEALSLFKQLSSGELDEYETEATLALLAEILFPSADPEDGMPGVDMVKAESIAREMKPEAKAVLDQMDHDEGTFADRLRNLMVEKGLTQAELASLTGIGQPAISMMLQRACRPQNRTVLRFAEALGVKPEDLWPAKP